MRLRSYVRALKRKVRATAVVIRQRDGTTRAFPMAQVEKHLFLSNVARMGGQPEPTGPVADALDGATPAERARVEALGEGGTFFEGLADPGYEPSEADEIPDLAEPE